MQRKCEKSKVAFPVRNCAKVMSSCGYGSKYLLEEQKLADFGLLSKWNEAGRLRHFAFYPLAA